MSQHINYLFMKLQNDEIGKVKAPFIYLKNIGQLQTTTNKQANKIVNLTHRKHTRLINNCF